MTGVVLVSRGTGFHEEPDTRLDVCSRDFVAASIGGVGWGLAYGAAGAWFWAARRGRR